MTEKLSSLSRDQLEDVTWRALLELKQLRQRSEQDSRLVGLLTGFLAGAAVASAAFLFGALAG